MLFHKPIRVGGFLVHHTTAADEYAREREDRRCKSDDAPKDFGKPVEPPEVQLRQPKQPRIGKPIRRINEGQRVGDLWEGEVNR